MDDRPLIFDLDRAALRQLVQQWGMPAYRADQVLQWVYQRYTSGGEELGNLTAEDRKCLAERLRFRSGRVVGHQRASDGVQKLLIEWDEGTVQTGAGCERLAGADPRISAKPRPGLPVDDEARSRQTECVMIPAGEGIGPGVPDDDASTAGGHRRPGTREAARRTACVSSQVGCPVGCRFCASGLGGLDGNLSAGQIVEQVWQLGRLLGTSRPSPATNHQPLTTSHTLARISHVVFMGMGEPLANLGEVVRAVQTLTADWGLGISARRITISTVGLPAQMRRLAELDLPVTLAISLHAPNDEIRRRIIPWAQFVTIGQLLEAGRYYFERTGREVTLEYILLHDVNDRPEHARQVAQVAKELRSNVNLIRYNEVGGLPFARPDDADVRRFQAILRRAGVNTHIRASRGRDIAAACGQLRHEAVG